MPQTTFPAVDSPVPDVATWRRLARRLGAIDGVDAEWNGDALKVTPSGGGSTVDIAPGRAYVQGSLYENTDDPLILPVPPNAGGADRIDFVVLRYDEASGITAAIVQGTPGAGQPGIKNGTEDVDGPVWDMALARYTKTPAGAITNLQDRREFVGPDGTIIAPGAGSVYLPGSGRSRTGQRLLNPTNGFEFRWSGPPYNYWERVDARPLAEVNSGALRRTGNNVFTANVVNLSGVVSPISASFRAPLTGAVLITFGAAGNPVGEPDAFMGVRVTGPGGFSWGPGEPTLDNPNVIFWNQAQWVTSERTVPVTGLTPGLTYTATLMFAAPVTASGTDATWDNIRLMVERG